jgi:hypothetical protein
MAVMGRDVRAEKGTSQILPLQPACSDTDSTTRAKATSSGTVSTSVQPPSADELQRRRLSNKVAALEEKVSDVSAALSATNGGLGLPDNGAKLHAALRTSREELAAAHAELNALKASREGVTSTVSSSDIVHATSSSLQRLVSRVKKSLEDGGARAKTSVSAVSSGASPSADALADMLAMQATL